MNSLDNLDKFASALKDYQPSDEARQLLSRTKLVLLVGPSSSGRNTIIRQLLKSGDYHYIVSDTTREPRVNDGVLEQNGREYWFRPEAELLADLQAGRFLEAAIIHGQQVSGISMRELAAATDNNQIAINEVEVVGADNVRAIKPDTITLFVLPPSFDEWITRMNARGSLPEAEIRRRLHSAVDEITFGLAQDYYQFVVNDTFMHTAKYIDELIRSGEQAADMQASGRAVAAQLLDDTLAFLNQ